MAIDGTYQIEIDTPIGKQEARLALKTSGNTLTGTAETSMGNSDFTGTVNGNNVSWEVNVTSPMGKMKLEFAGTISGNDITGEAKAGSFGSFAFKGKKI